VGPYGAECYREYNSLHCRFPFPCLLSCVSSLTLQVNDFRTDDAYKDRPYVVAYPWFVSYLEVPLISPLGYVLGSYCVVDDRLHEFDNDETVGIMNDIAAAIMTHLDHMRMKQSRHRSEQLIQGLSKFIASEPSVVASLPDLGQTSNLEMPLLAETSLQSRPAPPNQQPASSLESFRLTPSLSQESTGGTPMTSLDSGEANDAPEVPAADPPNGDNRPANHPAMVSSPELDKPPHSGFISSANIKSAFFRAASTIRQAMDLDDVVFLDAAPTTYVDHMDSGIGTPETKRRRGSAGPFCATIVHASIDVDLRLTPPSPTTRLSEVTLQRLIKHFPKGHVFSADELGPIEEGYAVGKRYPGYNVEPERDLRFRDDLLTLFSVFPLAKYIIFLPLWHFQRECWYAASLGWVSDPTKAFDQADITLLSAWGNSVMAEVSRMEALAASRAKSSFVSSISHELRSPLHGIMASSEMIRSSISDASLLSTLDMLDSCGETLLDTFNNLLDHAIAIKDSQTSTPPPPKLQLVNLGDLVEQVIETVHAGHLSERAFQSTMASKGGYILSTSDACTEPATAETPLIVLDMGNSSSDWTRRVDVGAWKRIVMNIFGNALKYTTSGRIEVSLRAVQRVDKSTGMAKSIDRNMERGLRDFVCLRVEDTGRGMSADYLKYRVFTPFSQEDSYSQGIGLGLSIVQQLTKALGGVIDIRSSVGVGTVVEVCLPVDVERGQSGLSPTCQLLGAPRPEGQTPLPKGKTICLITPEAYFSMAKMPTPKPLSSQKRLALVERAIRVNAGDSLGMHVIRSTADNPSPPADVYIIDRDMFGGPISDSGDSGKQVSIPQLWPMILLCSGALPTCRSQSSIERSGVHVHHPLGPKKLLSAVMTALEMVRPQPEDSKSGFASLDEPESLSVDANAPSRTAPESTVSKLKGNTPVSPQDKHIPQNPSPPEPKLHLLLVDDNPINIKLLAATVNKLHHTYQTAQHGLEAVQLYEKSLLPGYQPFDVVFMDISMPVMDGFEAIREIRRLESEANMEKGAWIAALTGLSSEVSRKEAMASGSDLFLTKPVKLAMVKRILEEGWGTRWSER